MMLAGAAYVAIWVLRPGRRDLPVPRAHRPGARRHPAVGDLARRIGKERAFGIATVLFGLAALSLVLLVWIPGPWIYVPVALAGAAYAGHAVAAAGDAARRDRARRAAQRARAAPAPSAASGRRARPPGSRSAPRSSSLVLSVTGYLRVDRSRGRHPAARRGPRHRPQLQRVPGRADRSSACPLVRYPLRRADIDGRRRADAPPPPREPGHVTAFAEKPADILAGSRAARRRRADPRRPRASLRLRPRARGARRARRRRVRARPAGQRARPDDVQLGRRARARPRRFRARPAARRLRRRRHRHDRRHRELPARGEDRPRCVAQAASGCRRRPRLVAPVTVHAAFQKAAHYFGLHLDLVPVAAGRHRCGRRHRRSARRRRRARRRLRPVVPLRGARPGRGGRGGLRRRAASPCTSTPASADWCCRSGPARPARLGLPRARRHERERRPAQVRLRAEGRLGAAAARPRPAAAPVLRDHPLARLSGRQPDDPRLEVGRPARRRVGDHARPRRATGSRSSPSPARARRGASSRRSTASRACASSASRSARCSRSRPTLQCPPERQVDPHHWADAARHAGWMLQLQPGLVQPDGARCRRPPTSRSRRSPRACCPSCSRRSCAAADAVRGAPHVDPVAVLGRCRRSRVRSTPTRRRPSSALRHRGRWSPPRGARSTVAIIEATPPPLAERLLTELLRAPRRATCLSPRAPRSPRKGARTRPLTPNRIAE